MQTKAIKSKIKGIGNIKKITRTMEMVSVAKMRKAATLADSYKEFGLEAERLINILGDQRERHALSIKNEEAKKTLIIIVAGEKGLAGSYNSNIYRHIYRKYKNKNEVLDFICIGKYAEKIARRFLNVKGDNIKLSYVSKIFGIDEARSITHSITSDYIAKNYKNVNLVFTKYLSISSLHVTETQLLPFSLPDSLNYSDDLEYTFEPDVLSVYEVVIGLLLQNIIIGSVSNARAAEHSARMLAMKTATDNAGEMLSELKLWYNKARQAHITQEIAEISAGSFAK